MSLNGGVGCNSQNKTKKAKGSDYDRDSDFDEGQRGGSQKKESGGKGVRIRSQDEDRVLVPSDEETLLHKMERKRKATMVQRGLRISPRKYSRKREFG